MAFLTPSATQPLRRRRTAYTAEPPEPAARLKRAVRALREAAAAGDLGTVHNLLEPQGGTYQHSNFISIHTQSYPTAHHHPLTVQPHATLLHPLALLRAAEEHERRRRRRWRKGKNCKALLLLACKQGNREAAAFLLERWREEDGAVAVRHIASHYILSILTYKCGLLGNTF